MAKNLIAEIMIGHKSMSKCMQGSKLKQTIKPKTSRISAWKKKRKKKDVRSFRLYSPKVPWMRHAVALFSTCDVVKVNAGADRCSSNMRFAHGLTT